jgi:hypothetical protein
MMASHHSSSVYSSSAPHSVHADDTIRIPHAGPPIVGETLHAGMEDPMRLVEVANDPPFHQLDAHASAARMYEMILAIQTNTMTIGRRVDRIEHNVNTILDGLRDQSYLIDNAETNIYAVCERIGIIPHEIPTNGGRAYRLPNIHEIDFNALQNLPAFGPQIIPPPAPAIVPPVAPVIQPLQGGGGNRLKFPEPSKFSGKKTEDSDDFKKAAKAHINARGQGVSAEQLIDWIDLFLEGDAKEWLKAYYLQESLRPNSVPWMHDTDLFWTAFDERFATQNKVEKYRSEFEKVHQKGSVQEYIGEFKKYSALLGYNDAVLRDHFYKNLKSEITGYMVSQMFIPHNHTCQQVMDRAAEIDRYIEYYAPKKATNTSNAAMKSSPSASTSTQNTTQKARLSIGDFVYMVDPATKRAKKGVIESVGKTKEGRNAPNVKWNGESNTVMVPYKDLDKDRRPLPAVPTTTPKANNSGPAPMELDGKAGKLKCYNCQGYGHMASSCPSKPMSGHEIVGAPEGENSRGKGWKWDVQSESGKGEAKDQ